MKKKIKIEKKDELSEWKKKLEEYKINCSIKYTKEMSQN